MGEEKGYVGRQRSSVATEILLGSNGRSAPYLLGVQNLVQYSYQSMGSIHGPGHREAGSQGRVRVSAFSSCAMVLPGEYHHGSESAVKAPMGQESLRFIAGAFEAMSEFKDEWDTRHSRRLTRPLALDLQTRQRTL